MARNRVSSIQPTLANSIPNLTTLVLTSNNFAELADLDALSTFPRLAHLVLMENPVVRKEVRYTSKPTWTVLNWADGDTALSILGHMEMSDCEIPGLQEG